MKKKLVLTLTAVAAAIAVTACGGGTASAPAASSAGASEEASDDKEEAESGDAATGGTITVAATEVPHAEILEVAKPILAEKGWDLEVTVFSDYVQPNQVVSSGQIDANYFQHQPYLDDYNAENKTDLVSVGWIHYEPLGIYSSKHENVTDIEDGIKIGVPNDPTNEARALQLLQDNGIIKLKDGVGLTATALDVIAGESHNAEIVELEAAQVSRHIDELDYVVLNGNYAMEAGLNVAKDALAYESSDSEAAETYVNVIVVNAGNEENEGVKALVEVLESDAITGFIESEYQGSVVPFTGSVPR